MSFLALSFGLAYGDEDHLREEGRLTIGYTTIVVQAHVNAVYLMLLNLDVLVLLQ